MNSSIPHFCLFHIFFLNKKLLSESFKKIFIITQSLTSNPSSPWRTIASSMELLCSLRRVALVLRLLRRTGKYSVSGSILEASEVLPFSVWSNNLLPQDPINSKELGMTLKDNECKIWICVVLFSGTRTAWGRLPPYHSCTTPWSQTNAKLWDPRYRREIHMTFQFKLLHRTLNAVIMNSVWGGGRVPEWIWSKTKNTKM